MQLKRLFTRGPADSAAAEGSNARTRGIASVVLRLTGATLSFTLTIVLARMLGAAGLGVYSYAIAIATLGAMLAQMGLPVLVVRETARYRAAGDWNRLRGLLAGSAWLVIAVCLLCFAGAAAFIGLASDAVPAVNVPTVLPALVLIPMIALSNVGGASLRGLGYTIRGQLAEQLLRPGIFLACLIVAWVTTAGTVTPAIAMTMHALGAVAAFLTGATLLFRALPQRLRDARTDYADWSRLRTSLLPLSILAGLQVINGQTDVLMLGFFRDADDVRIYRVAHQGALLVNLTLLAIGLTVEPVIARLHLSGESDKLQHVVTVTARMAFALSAVMTVFLVGFGHALLGIVFGPVFVQSFVPLTILCVGQVAFAYAGWAVMMLNMSGNERLTARMTAYAAAANVVANALLIPPFGIYGAAIATASTVFVWKLTLSVVAERKTGIRTLIYPVRSAATSD